MLIKFHQEKKNSLINNSKTGTKQDIEFHWI